MRTSSTPGIDAPGARLRLVLGACAVAVGLGGCGAKTGLRVPDSGVVEDSGVDSGVDSSTIPCVDVPFDGGEVEVPLELEANLRRADVVFLVDNTGSMMDEINQIRSTLRDQIVPGVYSAIPDSAFGVATFADFPEGRCGDPGDVPFELRLPVTEDVNSAQAAVDGITLANGEDPPEAQVEALYQLATGEGFGAYVQPSFGCPMGGFGYPCFRPDALPIVLLFTDAPFHNGPGGSEPYDCRVTPRPHTYAEAVARLNALEIRVMGFNSGGAGAEGRDDLVRLARDTAAVDGAAPLVFDIGMRGQRLTTQVVGAIRTLADVIEFDVDAVLVDPDPADGVDPRDFVAALVPVRAVPMDRIEGIDVDAGVFLGVRAGTLVVFRLRLRNDAIVPGPTARTFLLEIVFRGDRRTRLGSRTIALVIPGADGTGCETPISP